MSKYINLFHCMSVAGLLFQTPPVFAQQDVQFFGAVTNTTCDVGVEVDGARGNVVNLGRVGLHEIPDETRVVSFTLMPDRSEPGCAGLSAGDNITVSWLGDFSAGPNTWGLEGMLGAQSGEASDAGILLYQYEPLKPDQYIYKGHLSAITDGKTFLDRGMTFRALLIPGLKAGTLQAAAAYVVTYN